MGASWDDQKIKGKLVFWSIIFSYCMQWQQTISQSDCGVPWKVNFIWQLAMTSSVIGAKRSFKHFPKPNLHKQRSWSLFGGLLPVWSTTTLWISVKPLHLRCMLSKWMTRTKNCDACSWYWLTEWAQFFSVTTPNCPSHNQCFKRWMSGPINFCLICYVHLASCQLITTSSSILTTFCRENVSTTSRRQKMLSKSSSTDFYATGINTFIYCWQNFVDCDGSCFA